MKSKMQITEPLTIQSFSLDEMYDESYSLQQIYTIFKHLNKNWKSLNPKNTKKFEEIHDYLAENFHKCYICGDYFEDHDYTDKNATRHECYTCFTEFDSY